MGNKQGHKSNCDNATTDRVKLNRSGKSPTSETTPPPLLNWCLLTCTRTLRLVLRSGTQSPCETMSCANWRILSGRSVKRGNVESSSRFINSLCPGQVDNGLKMESRYQGITFLQFFATINWGRPSLLLDFYCDPDPWNSFKRGEISWTVLEN